MKLCVLHLRDGWMLLGILLIACMVEGAAAQDVSLRSNTFSSGGSTASSGDITLTSSVGQLSPVGRSESGEVTLHSGFLATISIAPPLLQVDAPAPAEPGSEIVIEAEISSGTALRDALLRYREGGSSSYAESEMSISNGSVRGAIPSEAVTERGVAYHIQATDAEGRDLRVPAQGDYSADVLLSERGVVRDEPFPGGDDESAYRLVSVPVELDDTDPEAVLGNEFGSYDPSEWRLFELRSEERVVEYPDTGPMEPGRGFWLISREGGEIDTGPGKTVSLERPFRIELRPGWNLIGHPFTFPVPVENVWSQSQQGITLRAYSEQGFNDPITEEVTTLEPFEGYAVFNEQQSVDVLFIDPDVPDDEEAASLDAPASASASASVLDWHLQLAAQQGSARSSATAGVSQEASDGADDLSHPTPPAIGDHVSVAFPRPEWDHPAEAFSTDIRAPSATGHVWPLEVRTNLERTLRLAVEGMETVPEDFEVWLVDRRAEVATDLRATKHYEASAPDQEAEPLGFDLVVGTSAFVEQELGELHRPASFEMEGNFPNPFTESTTIRYGLPEDGPVHVQVYDVLGRLVATLVDEEKSAGFHAEVWDGRDRAGMPVASGTYFVRLRHGENSHTQSVTLVR